MLGEPMGAAETERGVRYETSVLDRGERLFWGDIWESVPADIAAEKGV